MNSSQQMANPFGKASQLLTNPIGQAMGNQMLEQSGIKNYWKPEGFTGIIFNKEIRSYFDVDTDTVKNKLMKLLMPFKNFEFDDQIKKLELYLPIVSLVTLIMFSTLLEGIVEQKLEPKIGKKTIWILIFTIIEIMLAKFTENAVSNLNLTIIQLSSLVSYRFVSLSFVAVILVLTNMAFPPLRFIGIIYALIVDTYYCKLELSTIAVSRFKEEDGMGNKIALAVHILTTVIIMWLSNIL